MCKDPKSSDFEWPVRGRERLAGLATIAELSPRTWTPGGLLSLEKATNCGPTSLELWQSQADMAKKGGLSSHYILPEGSCHSLECITSDYV